jgi:hypothetical protein
MASPRSICPDYAGYGLPPGVRNPVRLQTLRAATGPARHRHYIDEVAAEPLLLFPEPLGPEPL